MLNFKYENAPQQQAAGSDVLVNETAGTNAGDSDWADTANTLPPVKDSGNTLGGWL
ncbi:hypothetical protein [Glutamicibacter uratoxydans]|uniref:hypothetical protein n=1 Tax=Glutamicibacter uratoxydans TaxID=43667 RepID=UPI003D6F630F